MIANQPIMNIIRQLNILALLMALLAYGLDYSFCRANIIARECASSNLTQESGLKGPKCSQGNSCSKFLISYLDVIKEDLRYANKTIDIGKLKEKISMQLDDLESTFSEHYIGLKSSEEMLDRASNTIRGHLKNGEANVSVDSIQLLVENLEQEANAMADLFENIWPPGFSGEKVDVSAASDWITNSWNLRHSLDDLEEDLRQFDKLFNVFGEKMITDGFILLIAAISRPKESSDPYLVLLEETKQLKTNIIGLNLKFVDIRREFGLLDIAGEKKLQVILNE